MDTIRTIQDLLTCNGSAQSVTIELTSESKGLIAAAPELLEALKGLLANAPTPKGVRKDYSYILYLEAARAAIAKATS